jgi:hypothetical protein
VGIKTTPKGCDTRDVVRAHEIIFLSGGMEMKCYICAKQGVEKDAVAICIVCGMGLCLGHAFKDELMVRDIVDWGFGEEKIEYPHTLPRFICAECKLAIEQRTKKGKK